MPSKTYDDALEIVRQYLSQLRKERIFGSPAREAQVLIVENLLVKLEESAS